MAQLTLDDARGMADWVRKQGRVGDDTLATLIEMLCARIEGEREACARVADGYVADNVGGDSPESAAVWKAAGEIASEIRARGRS